MFSLFVFTISCLNLGHHPSFTSLEDANRLLIPEGFMWSDLEWLVVGAEQSFLHSMAAPDMGWLYNTDFSSFSTATSGHATKCMTHFVRRRKLTRTLHYDGEWDSTPELHLWSNLLKLSLFALHSICPIYLLNTSSHL